MNSLRSRLLVGLLGAVLLVGVAGGVVIYRNSLAEANADLVPADRVRPEVLTRALAEGILLYGN